MRFLWTIALSVSLVAAQDAAVTEIFEKAPPAVDEALRANINAFFQAHVDKKFRSADAYVAEDSKDTFFNIEKNSYLSFEIVKIIYSDNFTKAKVVTANEVEWRTPRMGKMIVKQPMNSLWKIENGSWKWYVLNENHWDTPFGRMTPGPENGSAIIQAFRGVDFAEVGAGVHVSSPEVRLSSFEPAQAEIEVINKLPGEVTVQARVPHMDGLEAKLDKKVLQQNETAKLTFKYTPPDKSAKSTITAVVQVDQTNQQIPVQVTFAVPDSAPKLPTQAQHK